MIQGTYQPQICTLLQQLRKKDLVLRWTAPSWARADKVLRETTKIITICRGWFSVKDDSSQWRSNRLFLFRSYNAMDYTDFSSLQAPANKLKSLQSSLFLLTRHLAPNCYDTMETVSTIGTVLMSGRCAVCGGRRRVPECSCKDYKH